MGDRLAELLRCELSDYWDRLDDDPESVGTEADEVAEGVRAAFQSGTLEDRIALLREVWPEAADVLQAAEHHDDPDPNAAPNGDDP